MLRFSKEHQHSNDWRTIWSAKGNMETVYEITKQDALFYVTIHQYGQFVQDTGSFNSLSDAKHFSNKDNDYLNFYL